MTARKKRVSAGQTIGGMLVGFDQQVFRTTPPVNELIAKGDRFPAVPAAGGGTMQVQMPGDPAAEGAHASEGPEPVTEPAPGRSSTEAAR